METLEIQKLRYDSSIPCNECMGIRPYYPFAAHRLILHMEKKLKVLPSANTSGG